MAAWQPLPSLGRRPFGVAVDGLEDIYIADSQQQRGPLRTRRGWRLRAVSTNTVGDIVTFAYNGLEVFQGDGAAH